MPLSRREALKFTGAVAVSSFVNTNVNAKILPNKIKKMKQTYLPQKNKHLGNLLQHYVFQLLALSLKEQYL